MRFQLRNPSYALSTNVGGETSFGRRQLEGIVKRRQARARILLKLTDREKGGSEGGTRYVRPLQLDSRSLSLSSGEVFFVKSGPHYRVVDGGELDPSIVHLRHDSSATKRRSRAYGSLERHSLGSTSVRRTVQKTKKIVGRGGAVE